jgi:hypothetical protein
MPQWIRFVAVLVLVVSMGLHWALLQTVAWTSMLVSYSRNASFAEAVVKTFDGKHPCPMCLMIRDGRQQEERQQKNVPLIKIEKMPDFILDDRQTRLPFTPPETRDAVPTVPRLHLDFIESPPTPPPRKVLAVL